jgi:hypothetical protein
MDTPAVTQMKNISPDRTCETRISFTLIFDAMRTLSTTPLATS